MPKLTKEKINQNVYNNTLQTCVYISGYVNSSSTIKIKCLKHNFQFETKYDNVRRSNRKHHVCPYCLNQDNQQRYKENRQEIKCAYCGKKFYRSLSKIEKSKSGLYFCCRQHKDLAQQIQSGKQFDAIRPNHYGTNDKDISDYRKNAFRKYQHKCFICGWNEDQSILEVHHIDENHSNNEISNLLILCPICHRKITSHKYKLINNNTQLYKINT